MEKELANSQERNDNNTLKDVYIDSLSKYVQYVVTDNYIFFNTNNHE